MLFGSIVAGGTALGGGAAEVLDAAAASGSRAPTNHARDDPDVV